MNPTPILQNTPCECIAIYTIPYTSIVAQKKDMSKKQQKITLFIPNAEQIQCKRYG